MTSNEFAKKTAEFAANKAENTLDRQPTAADYADTSDVPSAVNHFGEGPDESIYDGWKVEDGKIVADDDSLTAAELRDIYCVETAEEEFARDNGLTSYADLVNPF